jgi:DNA-directed RNA polymerase alpha subunit
MSFDTKLFKINKKAIKILKNSPNSLLEFLTTNPKTGGGFTTNEKVNSELISSTGKHKLVLSTQAEIPSKKQISKRVTNSSSGETQAYAPHSLNTLIANQKSQANLLNKYVFNKFFICCKESRIESPTSFYGCFYIGPFDESLSQTLAHNIRRTLLSQLSGLAITAVEIDGVLHKFSNLPGMKENVLDILCNLQNLVFKENIKPQFAFALKNHNAITLQKLEFTAYLRVRGPGIVTAADILLPSGLQCVNPNQYIATLAEDGCLNIKFYISAGQGQNYIKQKQKNTDLDDLKQQFLINNFGIFGFSKLGKTFASHEAKNTAPNTNFDNVENNTFQELGDAGLRSKVFPSLEKPTKLVQNNKTTSVNITGTASQDLQVGEGDVLANESQTNYFDTEVNANLNKNKIYLDSVFMPVTKVNTFVQQNDKCTDDYLENNLQFKFLPGVNPQEFKQSLNTTEHVNRTDSTVFFGEQKIQTKENEEKQDTIFVNQIKKSCSFAKQNYGPGLKNLKKQSTNFDAIFKTSKFNINSAEQDISDLKSIQEGKLQTFFQCLPNKENPSHISSSGDIQVNAPFEISAEQMEQVVVLTEKNKVGETSLNFKKQSHIVVEVWTNGSIHPREALKHCLSFLSNTFVSLENVKMLGSMFKSDVTYTKLLKNYKSKP